MAGRGALLLQLSQGSQQLLHKPHNLLFQLAAFKNNSVRLLKCLTTVIKPVTGKNGNKTTNNTRILLLKRPLQHLLPK
jgi:hypothetical protein